jgi:hypothetical protein
MSALCQKRDSCQCSKESRCSINFVGYAEHACWRLMSDYSRHRGSLKKGARDRSRYVVCLSPALLAMSVMGS